MEDPGPRTSGRLLTNCITEEVTVTLVQQL